MKLLLVCLVIKLVTVTCVNINPTFINGNTEEYGLREVHSQIDNIVIQFNGRSLLSDLGQVFAQLNNKVIQFNLSIKEDDIRFLLYTRQNPDVGYEVHFDNLSESFKSSLFNPNEKTIVLIHGFYSNASSSMPVTIRKAFLETGSLSNIIVVDWRQLSTPAPRIWSFELVTVSYHSVVTRSFPIVINRISEFLRFMLNSNLTELSKIHMIGHSLGAHIMGSVGRTLSAFPENNGKKVGHMTALDPARPFFDTFPIAQKVTSGDAVFVEIYNTAVGSMGITSLDDGHINYIPNGGSHQPGCIDLSNPFYVEEIEFGSCSHNKVQHIYAASMKRNITACACDPELAKIYQCPVRCSTSILVGRDSSNSARGLYYFETSENVYMDIGHGITDDAI